MIAAILLRIQHIVIFLPIRLQRLVRHLFSFYLLKSVRPGWDTFWMWWAVLLFQMMDVFGIMEWAECFLLIFKK
ncbi:MAG: hypothetical protein KDC24_07140, partial [Saprospiraceae bacterium]|nr:hypothetical protein [Saprospiraceae bacterium]